MHMYMCGFVCVITHSINTHMCVYIYIYIFYIYIYIYIYAVLSCLVMSDSLQPHGL